MIDHIPKSLWIFGTFFSRHPSFLLFIKVLCEAIRMLLYGVILSKMQGIYFEGKIKK